MPTRRATVEGTKTPQKQRFDRHCPACHGCGWVTFLQRVTRWFDGKEHGEDLPFEGEEPPGEDRDDCRIRYYRAARRCLCIRKPLAFKEKPEPMPETLKNARLGEVVKPMAKEWWND